MKWWDDIGEVTRFARVLWDSGHFDGVDGLFYFFSKPWKWEHEHVTWIAKGMPAMLEDYDGRD